jgi:hypothetical protein
VALPIYELRINPEAQDGAEVDYIALVDEPAIQRDFVAFNAQQPLTFAIQDEEKRIISGPAMVPDMLIYRNSESMGEHYVKFSRQTIQDIAVKFFRKKYTSNVNLMHSEQMRVDGVTIFESFITDTERGIAPMKGFEDLPEGTWFVSMYVDNDAVWNEVKAGTFRGLSVEGLFDYTRPMTKEEQLLQQIEALLNEQVTD